MSTSDKNTAELPAKDEQTLIKHLSEQNAILSEQIIALQKQVEELTRLLNKNSSNSHKPPSSDGLGKRKSIRKKKKPTGRKRGGQPGHKGNRREMLVPEKVDQVIEVFAEVCEICLQALPKSTKHSPYVHQIVDLMADHGGRYVTEYRCYAVQCSCGFRMAAPRKGIPNSNFGPLLSSAVCLLSGVYHLSRRQVVLAVKELYNIDISLGSVSNIEARMSEALVSASQEAMAHVEKAEVKYVDETSWLRDSARASLWVFATALVSAYRIVPDGKRSTMARAANAIAPNLDF